MVLLGEEAQVEYWFCLFGDSSNLDEGARFAWNIPYAQKINLDKPDGIVDAPDGTTR